MITYVYITYDIIRPLASYNNILLHYVSCLHYIASYCIINKSSYNCIIRINTTSCAYITYDIIRMQTHIASYDKHTAELFIICM